MTNGVRQETRAGGGTKQFEILPLKIFAHDSAPYLLAHVAKHDQVIVLNLQRLSELRLTTKTGTPPKSFRAEDWETQAFGPGPK